MPERRDVVDDKCWNALHSLRMLDPMVEERVEDATDVDLPLERK
jgi:hypothetical protein